MRQAPRNTPSMLTPQYRRLAYDTQLYYEGFPDDTLERAQDKLNFERDRLNQIQNPNHIDTFEKFIEFGEEEQVHVQQREQRNKEREAVVMFEGGEARHCTNCNAYLEDFIEVSKDHVPLCNKCQNDYVCGLVGDQQKGEKKRVAKLMEKLGANEKPAKKSSAKKEVARVSSIKQEQCLLCEKNVSENSTNALTCSKCEQRYHSSCLELPAKAALVKKRLEKWECPDCKTCSACNKTEDESKIIICEMCDQASHIQCLVPPLQKVPKTSWFCNPCTSCSSCKTKLEPIKDVSEGFWTIGNTRSAPSDRVCKPCHNKA